MIAWSAPLAKLLASAKPGTPKHKVYQRDFADGQLMKFTDAQSRHLMISHTIQELESNPKTLLYSHKAIMILLSQLKEQVVALQTDDASYINVGFALQKDSEFLEIMNHYILKEMEHGILMREIRSFFDPIYRDEQVGINEPQSLAFNNIMFVFICLGLGIVISLSMAISEKMYARFCTKHLMKQYVMY